MDNNIDNKKKDIIEYNSPPGLEKKTNLLYDNIIDDNWRNNKIKKIFCNNCGKIDHIAKKCIEPIISCGLVILKIKGNLTNKIDIDSIKNFFIQKYKFPSKLSTINNNTERELKNICINKYLHNNIQSNQNKDDIQKYINITMTNIEYCLVKRRHSMNYIQFIRGIYDITEIDNIILMFKRMTIEEYNKIKTLRFKELWDDLWQNISYKDEYKYEYGMAKLKFDFIRNNMMELLEKYKTKYSMTEWGFPKGRRNEYESNINCAIREFEEETGIDRSNIIILDRLYPLIEESIGSNGKSYRMIYYFGIMADNNIEAILDETNIYQTIEVGDIKFLSYMEALNNIREYNLEKKQVLESIMYFIMYNIRYYDKYYKKMKCE